MRVKLTPAFVVKPPLPQPPKDRIFYWDSSQPGFGLMVTAGGHTAFVVQYRAGRRSRRMHLKPGLSLQDARREAKKLIGDVARGGDPLSERQKAAASDADTFRSIAEEYVKREGKNLRSMGHRKAILERLIYPKLRARKIDEIRRSEIVRLLDKIEDERGPPMADQSLAVIRRVTSWHASRSDDFRSPIVRGMARTKPREHARQRILADDELRAVWCAAEASEGVFGPFVQFLLLTAARRTEAAQMARPEVADDVWTIPQERYKTGYELVIPLSRLAARTLAKLPQIGNSDFIFTVEGSRPLNAFSRGKLKFDSKCGVMGWTLHDLRRTARSLMSRAGVNADVAERCLGHVISGVRGTYDRHAYFDEKRDAFEALAALIDRIVNPREDNVFPLWVLGPVSK
jgi:integrase